MMPEAPDGSIEIGEATLATLHLSSVLKGEIPRVGVGVQKEILGIGKRIETLATDFVYDRLPKRLSIPRPFTYRKLLDRFTSPIKMSEIAALQSKFPPDAMDTWLSFFTVLQNSYAHLAEMLPVDEYNTYLGPKKIKPTSDKETEFYLQFWVIDDPCVTFQLMQQGALQVEQVQALLEFFPSLYSHMKGAILDALIARNRAEPSFMNLPPRADRGLATFKQQRVVPYGANIHVAPPQPRTNSPVETPKPNPALQTSGQKAASL